jgi:nonribosomal peptide synthetase DhbF
LPDPDPESSLRRDADTTDEMVHEFLSSIGGFDGALAWSDVQPILRAVRHDLLNASRFFATSYATPPARLKAPLRCVFGEVDPATEGFESRYVEWALFAEALTLHVVADGDHYFVRNKAKELARLIRAWDA